MFRKDVFKFIKLDEELEDHAYWCFLMRMLSEGHRTVVLDRALVGSDWESERRSVLQEASAYQTKEFYRSAYRAEPLAFMYGQVRGVDVADNTDLKSKIDFEYKSHLESERSKKFHFVGHFKHRSVLIGRLQDALMSTFPIKMKSKYNKIVSLIKILGEFDPEWYLKNNEDVRDANCDPWVHFVNHGLHENRMPNMYFSPALYMERYGEEIDPSLPAYADYVLNGIRKGRKI